MADLVGDGIIHVESKQLADKGASWGFASIFGTNQITCLAIGVNEYRVQRARIVLSATDLLHCIIIIYLMVNAVKVGDIKLQTFPFGRIRVDAVLAVWDRLVAVKEGGTLAREG